MISVLAHSFNQREKLRSVLSKNKIESRPFFYPAHIMPEFKTKEKFPNAELISKRGLNLPSFPDLTLDNIKFICLIIKNFLKNK